MRTGTSEGICWVVGVMFFAVLSGCDGEDAPCGPCGQVAGRWVLSLQAPSLTCPDSDAPPEFLELEQLAARITTTWDGGTATGTLYDSNRLSLQGRTTGGAETEDLVSVRAFYAAGLPDGGMDRLLDGAWTWTSAATGCAEIRRFTAQRQ
jgi:hypothetical protein